MTMATSRNVQPVALVANAKIARFSPHDSFACNKREIRKTKMGKAGRQLLRNTSHAGPKLTSSLNGR